MSDEQHETPEAEVVETPEVAETPPAPEPEPLEAEARRLGWKPKEEWRGDTSRWTDAATFMERATIRRETVEELTARLAERDREYTERLERIERANQMALKMQRERLKAEERQAVELGDVARYDALQQQRQELDAPPPPRQQPQAGPPPETQEWMRRNTWFNADPVMKAAAVTLANQAMAMGMHSPAEQLRYVDEQMPRQFPHKFGAKPTVSAVDPGGLGPVRKRAKGWDDIPQEDRRVAMSFIDDGTMTKEQYAKEYWAIGG